MNPRRLAALVRVRRVQQDQAAGAMAAAVAQTRLAAESTGARQEMLGRSAAPLEAEGPVWAATVAARIALGSALTEARQLEETTARQHVDAQDAWSAARRRTRALELLEERAAEAERAEEQRAEQRLLDEHSSRSAATVRRGDRS